LAEGGLPGAIVTVTTNLIHSETPDL
jgi:hypothetical protein